MSVLVSHPTGNANVRAVLRGLEGAGLLGEFWTTLAIPPRIVQAPILSEAIRRRLSQRSFLEAPWGKTHLTPWREATRQLARSAHLTKLTRHETGWASVDAVYDALDRAVARRLLTEVDNTTLIYAYEDGARESFIAAEKTGRKRIYDLPIAHWRTLRRLLEEEADRLPEWACTMEGLKDSQAKHDRKDSELHLANEVVVASSFTQKSVQADFPDLPVHVTPYGCPEPRSDKPTARGEGAPLELFFAGHLAQRKGIADLISALDLLAVDWQLTIAGPLPAEVPQPLEHFLKNRRVNWLGAVPHITLMEQMRQAHAFVFPSIVEGFGMVITEALAAGLPVITTPNTCGPDILTEGQDGYIIPIRDPEALADRITRLAENEPKRRAMAASALRTSQRMSWARYETQLSGLVTEWCDK